MRTRVFSVLLCLATPVLFAGKKANLAAIDELLAAHEPAEHAVGAPGGNIEPMPWAPGQWTLYKRTDKKGRVSLEKLQIVAKDACGFQVESIQWTKDGLTGTRICYAEMPIAWTKTEAINQATDLVRVFTTWSEGSDPMTIDLSTPEGAMMRGMMRVIGHGMMATLTLDLEAGGETITVEAGTFAETIHVEGRMQLGPLKLDVSSRAHPGVPINGNVRLESSDGSVTELVDFGLSGATAMVPGG